MVVRVDEAHPFDLGAYNASYNNRTAIYRLLYILELCPSLAKEAFQLAVQRIKAGRDPQLYQNALNLYNTSLPEGSEGEEVDAAWLEKVVASNTSERNKLEVELKTYTSNMIKESIRMAHRDLGNFYRATGDDGAALKHYTKSREYCTASQHVLDMCLSVLELLVEQRNYAHIPTYVYKADAALDVATTGASNSGTSQPSGPTQLHRKPGGTTQSAEREKIQTKLDVATAVSYLGQGNYERAAVTFLKLGPPKSLEDWNGKIITPSDIAIYGTLCALATMSRGAITAQLLDSETFANYLEYEPYVRELVNAYMGSKFRNVLELLERYSARHYLDIHLSIHIHDLTNLIRDRALVLYFQPFASVKLQKMSVAFGIPVDELEKLVVGLIQSGNIKGRVDSRNKILKASVIDQRAELFARAARAGAEIQAMNRKLLLRMRLQQADLIVKPPRAPKQAQGSSTLSAGPSFNLESGESIEVQ
ncbi:uncharacterized protein FOMMEDRAFT_87024 [Fomitiporia mediterranea MF3/22]|uniref:uncharacterized protein n=1 Tax=Fomitiporia mediterranea (strain MF3/22) TaxID=694068 RepID=UPI00044098F0|nr:uncharacterized protein FOMMEDRAFT_87024 [Fomitiporia mediterranea MF3/22]EJD01854.1 hypothetical protein FOMMEDRAFT_87024 [Fomitiporia mediterranea MF3/22]